MNHCLLAAHSSQAVTTHAQDDLTCSVNVAYDTASNTVEISSQAKLTSSGNITCATVRETVEEPINNTTPRDTAVYEEVKLT